VNGLPHVQPRESSLEHLADGLPDARVIGGNTVVNGIQYDSRLIKPGNLFAALVGADFDGHRFIDSAIERGAAALLVEQEIERDIPQIVAADSRAALAPVSAAFYGHPSRELTVTGITGTDGKTTTSHLLDGILRHAGHNTGIIGTVGIRIGESREDRLPHQTTPESNLIQGYLREMVEANVTHAIVEATSHGLAMHRLDGTRFTVAGVTNITHEHLEYHKTIDAYRAAKAILVERVATERGTVVLNVDDEGAMSLAPIANNTDVITFSATGRPAHLRALQVEVNASGSTFDLAYRGESHRIELPLIGEFNVANALCATGLALALGLELPTIIEALSVAQGVPGRMLRVDEGQPFTVIVDYAHTPESLTKILTLLRSLNPGGRLIAVSGSAGERDPSKRPLQGAVCQRLADLSIFTSEDPRNEDPDAIIADIAAGASDAGGIDGGNFLRITDRREAIAEAFARARPGDCILLAGKGHEASIIQGYDHVPWNEESVARTLLRQQSGATP
jgi:UDP-N-acetylmuramoyl-L-alanyl-D-glutamate--2,6-diaminopimelate ligase